jgi:autotransporter-associated beta strand protein
MNTQCISTLQKSAPPSGNRQLAFAPKATLLLVFLSLSLSNSFAQSPAIRFEGPVVRITVPLNSTNTTAITNAIELENGATNAIFSLSPLPVGAGATLTDVNSNPLPSTSADTNLVLTLNTTNLAPGIHTFTLNASGNDSNGQPLTNHLIYVLQAAHIWAGSVNNSNNWSDAASWSGGVPTTAGDVVFGTAGGQTNVFVSGIALTNIGIDADITIGSIRFAQTALGDDPLHHTLHLAPGRTLSITGTNGFSLLRDTIPNFLENPGDEDPTMIVNIGGGAGSRVVVSNANANISILLGLGRKPTLSMTNLDTFTATVNRMGLCDYQVYPNYQELNNALNAGRHIDDYAGYPGNFIANIFLARTNIIRAIHKDPDNYTNELTRSYAISLANSETAGNGSSDNTFVYLGQTNVFLADSVCFVRAPHATGNAGAFRFNPALSNAVAYFRSTNNARMSVFAVADGAGSTNGASGNTRAVLNFGSGNGSLDLLADKLYLARDRTSVRSNDNPTFSATLIMGRGTVDVNTAYLGFQEHSNKVDWTSSPYFGQAYRGYAQGELTLTGGVFRVNGDLIMGYTADNNPEAGPQQYNTRGQITINNATMGVSNIICDSGLNFNAVNPSLNPRINTISIQAGGVLSVTNTIGGNSTPNTPGLPGLPLDTLTMNSGTLILRVTAGRTNVFVKNFQNPGTTPSTIRIAALSGVTVYPTNIPLISYSTASPFIVADISPIAGSFPGVQGYIVNNTDTKTIELFLTTNAPKQLTWTGNANENWDLTSINWINTNGAASAFSFGDIVRFDDSSARTNINITDVVVANQTAPSGITISNSARIYTFTGVGGAIGGTAALTKQGTNILNFNASESGPLTVQAGTITGSGVLGTVTLYSNTVMNFSGAILGGLTSTGRVTLASGGSISGSGFSIRGGWFDNSGTVNVTVGNGSAVVTGGAALTNNTSGTISIDAGGTGNNWVVSQNSILANFGVINNVRGRLNLGAAPFDPVAFFGTGFVLDSDGGLNVGPFNDGRLAINQNATWSPGISPGGDIGTNYVGARIDINNVPATGFGTLRIDIDFSHERTNDVVRADKWNNVTGRILMTNMNPSFATFANGNVFQIFENNSGSGFVNTYDVFGAYPLMWPPLPAPGLQWGLSEFVAYGRISVTNSPLIWDGNGGATWDTNNTANNWKAALVYSDNQGAVFDDSANGSTTINLNSFVAPNGMPFTTNIVTGVSTNRTTNTPAMSPGIIVNNTIKDYVIAGNGKISGMTGLYKTGSGTLTILTTNDFTGNAFIYGGTVAVTNINGLGVQNNANGSSGVNVETFIDNGTLSYLGLINGGWPRTMVIGQNNGTVHVASATNELTAGAILGVGGITKTGPGTLVLNSGSFYGGGTTINEGILRINNGVDRVGTNSVTLAGGALQFSGGLFTLTNAINVLGSGSRIINTNLYGSSGPWSGSGSVTISNTSVLGLNGSLAGFSGTISLGNSSGNLRFNSATNSNNCLGSAAATFDLGTGSGTLSNLNGAGLTYDLGALLGGANTVLGGRSTNVGVGGTTYSIGANGSSTVFSGRIVNGNDTVSVNKVGSGTLALNGANTYTGPTTVSAGTLGGHGSLSGPLSVLATGTLAPGTSAGRFTVNNSVTLAGTTIMELDRLNGQNTNDFLVANSITPGGALIVTNIGPTIFNNSVFKLFSVPVTGFTSVTLPAGYGWNNNLAVDGTIQLTSGGVPATNSPTMTSSTAGNALTLNWPPTHLGWNLQVQTNTLAVGLSTNWVTVPGSSATNTATVTISPAAPAVFYRLTSP